MESSEKPLNNNLDLKNYDSINEAYTFEEGFMLAIQYGDANRIDQLYTDLYASHSTGHIRAHIEHRLPDDRLRHEKNNCVILNTLSRTAARKGGLPIVSLHIISEKFATMIEVSQSYSYLRYTFPPILCKDYAKAVSLFSTKGYDPIVKEVISYLTSNITVNLMVSELAEKFDVNPSTLSRKFKEDTNMSIPEYINHQRVELAKYYFEKGNYNVTEVSYKIGFNDSSYFTKVFKKITGILPNEYIKGMKGKQEESEDQ